jgi:hypothetical protein
MEQTAWVHKLGSDKYGPWNWRKTGVCASTYVNAILRHLNAWRDGEDLDPESGFSHLAHIACSANILMDAAKVGKLQDDRNKRPTNDETEEGSPKVGEFELDEELMNDIYSHSLHYARLFPFANLLIRGEDEEPPTKHVEDNKPYEDFWGPLDEDTTPEYRVLLREGDKLQDGDEVYVGEDHWLPVYVADWMTPSIVRNGTYRRKITNCDLKEEPKEYTVKTFPRQYEYLDEGEPIQKGDEYYSDVLKKWTPATLLFERVPSSSFYRRPIKSCCPKLEPQLDRCKDCSKPLTYNWLMGFLCEDCELKYSDPYETH